MMHPKRVKYKGYLLSKLENAVVVMDRGLGIWDTSRRAWLMFDPNKDYHIVIQDDAIIGKGFLKKAEEIMKEDAVYNFYMGRPRFTREIEMAKLTGKRFLVKDNLHHEICFAVPTKRVKEMVGYVGSLNPDSDRFINHYVRREKLRVIFPMPSMIDHRNEGTLHSLNRGNYLRKANWFIGE